MQVVRLDPDLLFGQAAAARLHNFDTVVVATLDRVQDDVGLVQHLRHNQSLIFGVARTPLLKSCRHLATAAEVRQRFADLLDLRSIQRCARRFVVWGVRRSGTGRVAQGPASAGLRCSYNGVQAGRHCVCRAGFMGPDCSRRLSDWYKIGHVGPTVHKRSAYLVTPAYTARQRAALPFLRQAGCRHLLEFAGYRRPLLSFMGAEWGMRITNVDPLSPPLLNVSRTGDWVRRSLPLDFTQYTPEGDEDCFAFLGFDCRTFPEDAVTKQFAFLRRMKLVVLEAAQSPEETLPHEECLEVLKAEVMPQDPAALVYDHNFYAEIASATGAVPTDKQQLLRMNRHLTIYRMPR